MTWFIQDAWYFYSNAEGKFSIDVPAKMHEKIIRAKTDIGQLEYHNFTSSPPGADSTHISYRVSYVDYPLDFDLEDSLDLIQTMLETTVEQSVGAIDGELMYQNEDYSYQYPGRVWRIHYQNGQSVVRAKAFIRGNRFYLLQALYPLERNEAISDHFFRSLRLN
ncbi:MAG: hypothetical protein KDC57_05060 [Saprospiraceae bacterium]|nr:hypothetical protein [Saprospiraceae bacterium]